MHRKVDITQYSKYRLLSTFYKVFFAILLSQIVPFVQNIIGPYQRGFTPGKSATVQIFSLQQTMEKLLKMASVAPSLHRLRQSGIPTKLMRLILTNVQGKIKIAGSLSRSFAIKNDFRQGDALSYILLNLVIRDADVNAKGIISFKSVQLLAYIGDIRRIL